MRVVKSVPVEEIVCRGSIKDSDVARLAEAIASDQNLSEEDANTLFLVHVSCPVQAPSWSGFFVGAIASYILKEVEPQGYVTAEKSVWLKARILNGTRIRGSVELRLLLHVIEHARWVPLSLAVLVLEEVRATVLNGDGPLRAGKVVVRGIILDAEVTVLRDVLSHFARGSSLPITRSEADVLFAISAATASSVPPSSWTDLFVQAVANLALTSAGFGAASRDEFLRVVGSRSHLETPIEVQVREILSSLHADYRRLSVEERALARLERQRIEIVTNEDLDMGGKSWLADRLLRSRRRSALEAAVLSHIRREFLLADDWSTLLAIGRDGRAA